MRGRRSRRWGRKLAAAGLCGALSVSGAAAKLAPESKRKPDRQHRANPVVFSADDVTYDDQLGIVLASGSIELSQSGRTVLADVISYNQRTDSVIASGHVSLIDENTGETTFASYVQLTDNMRDGFIKDVRAILSDRSRLAGNSATRTDANRTELRQGVYSACDSCADDPKAPPLWQIKAAKIVHDQEEKTVEYQDASIEVEGTPVFWTPYLSHPDPTERRKSGFLAPTLGVNSVLGFNVTIPYFWAIDEDKDVTFSPIFTSEQGAVLAGEYRQRFAAGALRIRASVTDSDPNPGDTFGESHTNQLRGHIFAEGSFDIDAELRAGFAIERTSDLVYLQEYKIFGNTNFLTSRAYLEDFSGRNYGSIFAYDFQSLREGISDRSQPVVLPVAGYTWSFKPTDWGGRFAVNVNGIDIVRETGPAARRLSVGGTFELPFTALYGQKFNLLATVRGDGYDVMAEPLVRNGPLVDGTTGRALPQIGFEWRYPWIRRDRAEDWIIEPMVAAYAAPVGLNPPKIPDNDSIAVDFNDTDLFVANRFVGYDRVDSGQRVDYGLHGAWHSSAGQSVDVLVGQSYRFQHTSPFDENGLGDGLDHRLSDYVGRIQFNPSPIFDLAYHFRFNELNLRPERQEVGANLDLYPIRLGLTYLQLGTNFRDEETARQQIAGVLDLALDRYWTLGLHGTHDLAGDNHFIAAGVSARYSDECTTLLVSFGENGTVIGDYHPGTTLLFQVVLKNLGEIAAPSIETTPGRSEPLEPS